MANPPDFSEPTADEMKKAARLIEEALASGMGADCIGVAYLQAAVVAQMHYVTGGVFAPTTAQVRARSHTLHPSKYTAHFLHAEDN